MIRDDFDARKISGGYTYGASKKKNSGKEKKT